MYACVVDGCFGCVVCWWTFEFERFAGVYYLCSFNSVGLVGFLLFCLMFVHFVYTGWVLCFEFSLLWLYCLVLFVVWVWFLERCNSIVYRLYWLSFMWIGSYLFYCAFVFKLYCVWFRFVWVFMLFSFVVLDCLLWLLFAWLWVVCLFVIDVVEYSIIVLYWLVSCLLFMFVYSLFICFLGFVSYFYLGCLCWLTLLLLVIVRFLNESVY